MKRREFITLAGGAAAWPVMGHAQTAKMPVIGHLSARDPNTEAHLMLAFDAGLKEFGFIDGLNVAIFSLWAEGKYDRLPALAAQLVHLPATIIFAAPTPAALAAKDASATIPVLFNTGGDPVQLGLVTSLNRPGGNITGYSSMSTALAAKRLGLLHDLIPSARNIAVLSNPENPNGLPRNAALESAASARGLRLQYIEVRTDMDMEASLAAIKRDQTDALLVTDEPFFFTSATKLLALAARYSLPAIYFRREFAALGGLMSYDSEPLEAYRQLGAYAGRLLKGEKAATLPVMQPTRFKLIINLKTTSALGLTVPPTLLSIADEVIE